MSQSFGAIVPAILFLGIVFQIPDTSKEFESTLFQKGTLVYEDTFDAALDRNRWQPRTKNWKVEEGVLVGQPDFKSAKEAEKALGRDHHLGLGPVIRLNKLPDQFVLRLRFCFLFFPVPVFFPWVVLHHSLELTHFPTTILLDALRESPSSFASTIQHEYVHQRDSSSLFPEVVDVPEEYHSCGY